MRKLHAFHGGLVLPGHKAESTGSRCVACHMQRIVAHCAIKQYGEGAYASRQWSTHVPGTG